MGVGRGFIYAVIRSVRFAVQEQEAHVRIGGLHLIDRVLEQIARADDDLRAFFNGRLDGFNAGLGRVFGGTIIVVGNFVGSGEFHDAVPGAFVKRFVVDVSHVGDQGNFVAFFLGQHGSAHQQHGKNQQNGKQLLHSYLPLSLFVRILYHTLYYNRIRHICLAPIGWQLPGNCAKIRTENTRKS